MFKITAIAKKNGAMLGMTPVAQNARCGPQYFGVRKVRASLINEPMSPMHENCKKKNILGNITSVAPAPTCFITRSVI